MTEATAGPQGTHCSLHEAAAALGLKPADVQGLASRGELPSTWVPSRHEFFFLKTDVATYLERHPR